MTREEADAIRELLAALGDVSIGGEPRCVERLFRAQQELERVTGEVRCACESPSGDARRCLNCWNLRPAKATSTEGK